MKKKKKSAKKKVESPLTEAFVLLILSRLLKALQREAEVIVQEISQQSKKI